MKANELMVSDYIIVADEIARVVALFADGRISYICPDGTGGVTLEAKPIPLTAEILEKNGFHYTNSHTLTGADTYVLRLDQRGFDYTITIKLNDYIAWDSYDDRMYRLAVISTGKWCVHELQHFFRLCGIEKEITI